MELDNNAIECAVRAYMDYDGGEADIWGRCGAAMRKAVQAYIEQSSKHPLSAIKQLNCPYCRSHCEVCAPDGLPHGLPTQNPDIGKAISTKPSEET